MRDDHTPKHKYQVMVENGWEPGIREIRRLFREVCVLHAWVLDYVSGLELSSGDELSLELSWFIGYGV